MAISLVGSDTSSSSTTNVTMDLPVGTAQNDVSYAALANRSTTNRALSSVTADYVELCDLYASDTSDAQLGVYRKVQGATPDSTVELAQSTANGCNGLVIVLRGVDTTTPEDATTTTAQTVDTGTPDPPSIDTATAGSWVLPFASSSEPDTISNAPTNYTNLVAISTVDGFAAPVAVSTREISSPGTEDPGTYADIVGDTNDSFCAATVAVKPAAGGATEYDLVADAVSFTYTATAASLEWGRELVPDAVAYTYTAQDATLSKGIPLAADSVAYGWTATDAALEHGFAIDADAVSYSWTITNAGLERGYEIVPEAVAWTYSLTDASLEHGYAIDAEAVSYTWTVDDATLTYGVSYELAADAVSYAWSVTDAALEYGRLLSADAVSWQWGVDDATLTITATTTVAKDSGAGAGRKKRREEWKIIPLDEWLKLHHPEESVEEQIEAVEEIAETIEDAPNPVVERVYRELTQETARVSNLVNELKREANRVSGLTGFLEEMAEYKSVLESTKRKIRSLERNLREMDDEEALMLILDHA